MSYILAIDNGTQSIRTLLFDLNGQIAAKAQLPIEPYFSREPGWAEQSRDGPSPTTHHPHEGRVRLHNRTEMLDLVVVDGRAAGIVTRHLTDGRIRRHAADAVVLSKTDLLPVLDDFRPEHARRHLQELANPAPVIELSAKTGAGLDRWLAWLHESLAQRRATTTAQDPAAATAT